MDYALPLLQGLWKILKSKPVPSKIGMSPAQRTVFQTYEAFYGQAYFVDDKANQYIAKNGAAIKRLEELIGNSFSEVRHSKALMTF
jgi:hypothetical protein